MRSGRECARSFASGVLNNNTHDFRPSNLQTLQSSESACARVEMLRGSLNDSEGKKKEGKVDCLISNLLFQEEKQRVYIHH